MNMNKINELLEKYWNAETTLEEEKVLSQYFSSDEVREEHLPYQPLFALYASASQLKFEKEITLPETTKVVSMRKIGGWSIMGIAASLLLLISVGIMNFGPNQTVEPLDVFAQNEILEEAEALEVTRQALAYLGTKWDDSSQFIKSNVSKMESVSIIK